MQKLPSVTQPQAGEKPLKTNNSVDFPEEIILNIFLFLNSPRQLATLSLVCKKWNRISNTQDLWKIQCFNLGVTRLPYQFTTFKVALQAVNKGTWKESQLPSSMQLGYTYGILSNNLVVKIKQTEWIIIDSIDGKIILPKQPMCEDGVVSRIDKTKFFLTNKDNYCSIYDPCSNSFSNWLPYKINDIYSIVLCKSIAAILFKNRKLDVWDLHKYEPLIGLDQSSDRIACHEFITPSILAVGYNSGTISVIDIVSKKALRDICEVKHRAIKILALPHKQFVAWHQDHSIQIYGTNGTIGKSIKIDTSVLEIILINKNYLALKTDGDKILIINHSIGKIVNTLKFPNLKILKINSLPTGELLISTASSYPSAYTEQVQIWNPKTGQTQTIQGPFLDIEALSNGALLCTDTSGAFFAFQRSI